MKRLQCTKQQKLYKEKAAAIAAALLVWQIAAMLLNQKILLASPIEAVQALGTIMTDGAFLKTIGFSFLRIIGGFLLGLFAGSICAVLAAEFHVAELLLWPYMAVIKATPVASFIILCLVWLNSRNLSVFICFLMVLPVVYTNLLNGIRSIDPELLEMAAVYEIKPFKKLLAIYLPGLRPYLFAAFEISIGMAWKAGIAAEVIGVPAGSIGKMLYYAKIYLATPELFAWSAVVVAASILFEKIAVALLKKIYQNIERVL